MDATQWPQVRLARSMEEIIPTNNNPPPPQQGGGGGGGGGGLDSNNNQRRLSRPQKDQSLNCPRCNSTNTKFCYYNNYSLTQPRYFCKACRRYWTQGGSLRNVPVGGGSRKNKRSTPPLSSSSSSIAPSSSPNTIPNMIPDLNPLNTFSHFITPLHENPSNKIHPHPHAHHHHGQDLNLAFPTSTMMNQSMEANKVELPNSSCSTPFSALELLRTGMSSSSSLSSQFAIPDSNPLYTSSGFPNLQEMKPGFLGFPNPAHGLELGPSFSVGSLQENSHQNVKLLFPFGDVNKFSSHQNAATNTTRNDQVDDRQSIKGSTQDHHHHHGATGYWNGMLGGTW